MEGWQRIAILTVAALAVATAAVGVTRILRNGGSNTPEGTAPPCRREQLQLSSEARVAAANSTADYFSFTNTGRRCSLRGYPKVQLIDADGEPVDQEVARGGGYATYDPKPRPVVLNTRDRAWFAIASQSICDDGAPAPNTSALEIRPPHSRSGEELEQAVPYCESMEVVSVTSIQRDRADLAPSRDTG